MFRAEAGLTWSAAEVTAVALGGTLAAITSADEEALVLNLLSLDPLAWNFEPHDNAFNGPWIGLVQAAGSSEPGGVWGWVTGESSSYSDWHSGQPDNYLGDTVGLFWNAFGAIGWGDQVDDPITIGYTAPHTGLAEIGATVSTLNGTNGHDMIWAADIANKLNGLNGDDLLYGNGGKDKISGGADNDVLFGGLGNDTLLGGSGNDILQGDSGQDVLTGGSGADVFVFVAATDSSAKVANADTITDFSSLDGDVISLTAIDAIAGGADDAFVLHTGAFTAAGQVRITDDGVNTTLALNLDADKSLGSGLVLGS